MNQESIILTYFQLNEKERIERFFAASSTELMKVGKIAVGYAHIAVINDDGTVSCCGDNRCGQCNTNGWHYIIKVAAGHSHTVGLKGDGTVVAAGDNSCGQCEVAGWKDIVDIYADKGMTVGVDAQGGLHLAKALSFDESEPVPDPVTFGSDQHSGQFSDGLFQYYKLSDGTLRVTKYLGSSKQVAVSSNVSSIGYRAFYGNTTVQSIFIPDSVSVIGKEAFAACPNLKMIKLPDNITQIGKNIIDQDSKTALMCTGGLRTANLLVLNGYRIS